MPRFVILEHDHPTLHWDLMLEAGEVLQTWRLSEPPLAPECDMEAFALADHRLVYLEYEGPISGNRGTVRRFDAGTFVERPDSSPTLRRLSLQGMRVQGQAILELVLESAGEKRWRFRWQQE